MVAAELKQTLVAAQVMEMMVAMGTIHQVLVRVAVPEQ
jgi:hypothetical protein